MYKVVACKVGCKTLYLRVCANPLKSVYTISVITEIFLLL